MPEQQLRELLFCKDLPPHPCVVFLQRHILCALMHTGDQKWHRTCSPSRVQAPWEENGNVGLAISMACETLSTMRELNCFALWPEDSWFGISAENKTFSMERTALALAGTCMTVKRRQNTNFLVHPGHTYMMCYWSVRCRNWMNWDSDENLDSVLHPWITPMTIEKDLMHKPLCFQLATEMPVVQFGFIWVAVSFNQPKAEWNKHHCILK